MKVTDNYVLFWGSEFSQWFKSSFIYKGIKYNTAEQFMMANKALLFKDKEMFQSIMKTNDPKKQKEFGRKVKGFDKKIWEKYAKQIVYLGTYLKFSQNEKLKKSLLSYNNKEFVEASPKDVIWGIGLHYNDVDCLDKSKWKGTNWLGECLTEVRNDFNNNNEDNFNDVKKLLEELYK